MFYSSLPSGKIAEYCVFRKSFCYESITYFGIRTVVDATIKGSDEEAVVSIQMIILTFI